MHEGLSPAVQLSRRDLLKGLAGLTATGLLAGAPKVAEAQEPGPQSDLDEAQAENLQAQTAKLEAEQRNADADTELKKAQTTNTDADTALKEQQQQNGESWRGTVGDIALPVTAATTLASTAVGVAVALHTRSRERAADAAAEERRAEDQSLASYDRILTELATHDEEVHKTASRRLVSLAKSERLFDQLQVFDITRSLLEDRQTENADPRLFSGYETNIINAFLAVLPKVRESGQRSAPFEMGMEPWPEPVVDCRKVNLSGVDLSGHDLRNVDFTHGRFRNTIFQRCVLKHTIFNGADLRDAMFLFMTNTPDTSFRRVLLQGADLRGTTVRTRFLEEESFYEQINFYAADIQGLILLGDRQDATKLPDSKIQQLVDRGAKYLPRNKDAQGNVEPGYLEKRTEVRVKPITGIEE